MPKSIKSAFSLKWLQERQEGGKIRGFTLSAGISKAEGLQGPGLPGNTKYNSRSVIIDGIRFASTKEGGRYLELKMMQSAGLISDLKLQVPFVLIEKSKTERSCKYLADFVYLDPAGKQVVEDTKSSATRKIKSYIIKRKLMAEKFGITIKET